MKKKIVLFISIWKTMCMRIIPDLHLGILEKYYTSHFLGFLLCNAKKKDTGKCQAYWRCFCYRKRDYPEYPKRPQIFHRRGFLVTQINTEYSEDISQLRLENDENKSFSFFLRKRETNSYFIAIQHFFLKRGWAYISV